MQDQENWTGSGDGPNKQQDQDQESQDGGTLPYSVSGESSASGWKGGEAGGDAGSTDTSDSDTDIIVEAEEAIGIGDANEDFDEAGGDSTDNIVRSTGEDDD